MEKKNTKTKQKDKEMVNDNELLTCDLSSIQ